jgi:hypothetical protein
VAEVFPLFRHTTRGAYRLGSGILLDRCAAECPLRVHQSAFPSRERLGSRRWPRLATAQMHLA